MDNLPPLDLSGDPEALAASVRARRAACSHPPETWGLNEENQHACGQCGTVFDLEDPEVPAGAIILQVLQNIQAKRRAA